MKAAVLTISDSCARGTRVDESGPSIVAALERCSFLVVAAEVVPDDAALIRQALCRFADELGVDVVLTTGGTGLGPRDVTPEATSRVVARRVPGIPELLRSSGLAKTPHACLSRGEAGLRGRTLIVNLPGSLRAVREGMAVLEGVLGHAVRMLAGEGHA